jgi:hypothetical protein
MQNSIPRLLESIAQLMRSVSREHCADHFLAAQLAAGAEILDNLAPRVGWRTADIAQLGGRIQTVLGLACREAPEDSLPLSRALLRRAPPTLAATETELAAWRDDHLRALMEVQDGVWGPDGTEQPVAAAVASFVAWQLETERSRLRVGSEGDRAH